MIRYILLVPLMLVGACDDVPPKEAFRDGVAEAIRVANIENQGRFDWIPYGVGSKVGSSDVKIVNVVEYDKTYQVNAVVGSRELWVKCYSDFSCGLEMPAVIPAVNERDFSNKLDTWQQGSR